MTPDQVYDYAYDLRISERRLAEDPDVREEDRKLIQAFMNHIRPQGISTGRKAKYVNLLHRCAQLIQVPFRRAKRRDVEDLVTRLSDYEIVTKNGRRHYSPATMADFRMTIKRFPKFVRYGDTDITTPFPDEVKWLRNVIKLSDRREPEFFTDAEIEALVRASHNTGGHYFLRMGRLCDEVCHRSPARR